MSIEAEYHLNLSQEILARAGSEENFTRSAFLDIICERLEAEGALYSGYQIVEFKRTGGIAVDAWSHNDEMGVTTLLIGDFRGPGDLQRLTATEVKRLFKRLASFHKNSENTSWVDALEESDPGAGPARFLLEKSKSIEKIRLVIVTDSLLSDRFKGLPKAKLGGLPTTYEIWDLGRFMRLDSSARGREDIRIDFSELPNGGLPCLPAFERSDSNLKSYLLVMPGQVVADLYQEHGERLLEQNVRTFLQFRGKINKGIRNTIVNEPNMFFSYNNGLSVTAESVETSDSGNVLIAATNLQVVNGGQTTASIYSAARKDKADLSRVYVQVKLSVIEVEAVDEIVPKISEYSNTQNRVNAADFFSNHPFHLRIEEFSRRLWAPSKDGGVKMTRWFYERARGQYANQQAHLTPAKKKAFRAENPRAQMFTKTDLSKFILSFEEAPNIVSLGAQKAFAGSSRVQGFVTRITKEWDFDGGDTKFNELWFKRAIGKAICFRAVDRYVYKQEWYRGYKANIVTYTIAKMAYMARTEEKALDFERVWEKQEVSEPLLERFGRIAEVVNQVLHSPPEYITANISEYAKREECWENVKAAPVAMGGFQTKGFINRSQRNQKEKEAAVIQEDYNRIAPQLYVVEQGPSHWVKLRDWNLEHKKLSPKEMGVLDVACSIPKKVPTDKQSEVLVAAEKRALEEGFFPGG